MIDIRIGDIVLVKTHSFVGRAIRFFTRSKDEEPSSYNHAALVVHGGPTLPFVYVVEALDSGTVIRPLSFSSWKHEKKVFSIWRLNEPIPCDSEIVATAHSFVGLPYPYKELAYHALDWAVGRVTGKRDVVLFRKLGSEVPICSELVARCLINFFGRPSYDAIDPDHIHDYLKTDNKGECKVKPTTYEKLLREWKVAHV